MTSTLSHSATDAALAIDNICLTLAKDHLAFEKRIMQAEAHYQQLLQQDMELCLELLKEENDELTEENQDLYQTNAEMELEMEDLLDMADDLLQD